MRILLLAALLVLSACGEESAPPQEQAPMPKAGAVDRSRAGTAAPDTSFEDPDGEATNLAAFQGKPVLLNLWATWCAPCVKELPTLDALARRPGAPQVLALSQDMSDQAKVSAFLAEKKLGLEPYQDPDMAMSSALGVTILPTTVLYGSDGKEIWRYTGDMDWTGAEAAKLLSEAR
jgi:thiol-disulfide isomerase/thioredoxin